MQIGPSGDTPIQEQNSPVGGTDMSTISLAIQFDNNSAPAVSDLGGTVFAVSCRRRSLWALAGGTVETRSTRRSLPAAELATRPLSSATSPAPFPDCQFPAGGPNSLAIGGIPTAAGVVTFNVRATDSVGIQYTQNYALSVTDDDPTRSLISVGRNSITAGATATVTLTAITTTGAMATSGGLTVAFGLGSGGGGGTFGPVTDNGNGTYSAAFTGTIAGTYSITASINAQPVTTPAPSVTMTPGQVDLIQSTVSAAAAVPCRLGAPRQ